MTTPTKKYSLSQLISQQTDIELKHPTTGELTGITVTVLAADSPKILSAIAEAVGNLPKYPGTDATDVEFAKYMLADQQANRAIVAARVIASNDEGLSTEDQRKLFFSECDYSIIEQIREEGADRKLYFR